MKSFVFKGFVYAVIIKIQIIIILAANSNSAFAEAPKIIKFATLAPVGSTWLNVVNDISDELREKSDGKLRLKVYAGGISGDEKDVLRKMKIGQLHCAGFTGVGLGEVLHEVRIFDLPFFFRKYEEIDYIRSRLNDRFVKAFDDRGYVLLGWTEVGFIYFFSNKRIDSLEALKGTKMWVWDGDSIAKLMFDSIKISPIALSVTDVMTSLQTGLIESVYVSPLGAVALQWFTKVKYMLDLPMANAVGAILVSKKFFQSLSEEDQLLLKNTFKNHMERLTGLARKDNKEAIEIMRKYGVELITLEKEAKDEFELASKKACSIAAGQLFPAELIREITTDIEDFRNKP